MFTEVAQMRVGTYRHTTTFLPYIGRYGSILATGGISSFGVTNRAEIYAP